MKNLFRGYYAPTDEELDRIWAEGLIVLDTNALLNLFRYTEKTRDEFFMVLHAVAEQLWIPHQTGLEFQRRRLDVIEDQTKAYDDLHKAIQAGKNNVLQALNTIRLHPLLDRSDITGILDVGMKTVSDAVERSRVDYDARVVAGGENERVSDAISDLYTLRVGEPFDEDTLSALYVEGASRYDMKLPPGFKDKDKPEPDRYGDLIIWKQLLAHASDLKRPALFITDDAKEDWWRRVKGKNHGPRVELIDEYFEVAEQRVHFYAPQRFLDVAKEKLGLSVSEDSLIEVEEMSRDRPLRDTNWLFAERAEMQALRSEAQRALLFDIAGSNAPDSEVAQLEGRLNALRSSEASIRNQIRAIHDALEGVDDSDARSAALSYLSDLEIELRKLEHESARDFDRLERHARNDRTHGGDPSRRALYESQLRAAEDRIQQIDDLIDGNR